MAVESVLKSWLRQKYTDNNTLKSRFGSGTTLTVPDTSNSLAQDTDINTLLTSLRAMKTNVYLRYSPLWSSVNVDNVSEGTLIAQSKKTGIDNLMTDLLAMCVNYSKTPTEYSNSPQSSSYGNEQSLWFAYNSQASGFTQFGNAGFSFNSVNGTLNTLNGCRQTSYGQCANYRASSSYFRYDTNASGFNNDQSARFTRNDGNNTRFTLHTQFSQRFNYSFIVKSDRSTTSHSNIGN